MPGLFEHADPDHAAVDQPCSLAHVSNRSTAFVETLGGVAVMTFWMISAVMRPGSPVATLSRNGIVAERSAMYLRSAPL